MSSKIALVTGGSRGLGKNMAQRLAEKGSDVILTYLSKKEEAHKVVEEIEAMGRKAAALHLDVGNIASFESFVELLHKTLKDKWGVEKFDFLINNAGQGATIPFMQAKEADFDRILNINLKGIYFFTQKCVPLMNDGGRIVNLSTGTTRFCVFGYSMYASMKGAIEVFTQYLASELGPRKITANVVAPGPIETDFNNAAIRNNPERKAMLASRTALGRVGQVEDIGGIVAFLCSPDAEWINGQRIEATGGINL
jgi:NAD(P)-dependent dehydrogenase (short-subunit alcohol dehydrogenase family)